VLIDQISFLLEDPLFMIQILLLAEIPLMGLMKGALFGWDQLSREGFPLRGELDWEIT